MSAHLRVRVGVGELRGGLRSRRCHGGQVRRVDGVDGRSFNRAGRFGCRGRLGGGGRPWHLRRRTRCRLILDGDPSGLADYAHQLADVRAAYLRHRDATYADEQRWSSRSFWARRHLRAPRARGFHENDAAAG